MKNDKYQAEMKFNKRVNHLSSFIGMPLWNGSNPTLSDIREYDRRLVEKQSLNCEVQKRSFYTRLFAVLKIRVLKSLNTLSMAKQKTKKAKHKMPQTIKTEYCC